MSRLCGRSCGKSWQLHINNRRWKVAKSMGEISLSRRAVVLALHGFGDYSNGFATLGPYLATQGVLTFAYDQRGFGATAQRGLWGGEEHLIADLKTLTRPLWERYPPPLVTARGEHGRSGGHGRRGAGRYGSGWHGSDGAGSRVLRHHTPHTTYPIQNWTLKVATHMLPSLKLAESRSGMRLSDNIDMLRAHRSDPLAMNETRVDALWGLTNLMDRAMAGAARLPGPTLLRRLAGTFTSYSIERAGIC